MQMYTIADITGDSAAHQIAPAARMIVVSATGGALRVGDINVTATRGANVAQNTSIILPPDGSDITAKYPAGTVYVYVPSSTTASISYGI